MKRGVAGLLGTLLAAALAIGQPGGTNKFDGPGTQKAGVPTGPRQQRDRMVPVIHVAVRPVPVPLPALKYRFTPDVADQVSGDAAILWLRAGQALRLRKPYLTNEENQWGSNDIPLKELPVPRVRQLLSRYDDVLELTEQAAKRDRCNWDIFSADGIPILLEDIEFYRQIANLLRIRTRLELAERRYDAASQTLQIGFTLARHVGAGPSMMHCLIGVAIAGGMCGRVEEWIQIPDSPNLYWAMTTLPRPFIDFGKTVESELAWQRRSFPHLRKLAETSVTSENAAKILEECLRDWESYLKTLARRDASAPSKWPFPPGFTKASVELYSGMNYQNATQFLLAQGASAEQLKGMSKPFVVALYYQKLANLLDHDVLKWTYAPFWQSWAPIQQAAERQRHRSIRFDIIGMLLGVSLPGISKSHAACARIERVIAEIRCAEAIRFYAGAHDGKLPGALNEITEVPLPVDPMTGKGFDTFYKLENGKAFLIVPPPPNMLEVANLGKRYEFSR